MEERIGNYKIEIVQGCDPESPRTWDNLGTMVCFHGRYNLGDKHSYRFQDYDSWDEMEKAIIKNEDVAVILPLYLYDHSGITISTTSFDCRWDSGQIGFIFISKKKVREEYSINRITKEWKEKVTKYLEGEVDTYDQYLRGDIYGYKVSKISVCDLGCEHEEVVDSCGGFYGEDNAFEEAKGIVEYRMKEEEPVLV